MKILDELGAELVRAAREDERAASARPLHRLPRAIVLALGGVLVLAAVAVAASLVIGRGDPIPPAPPGQVPVELRPVPGTARLNGLDVPDPDGGPAWDVRTSRSTTGATCATIGQVLDGELGIVGLDRRFRALPAGSADTCSTPQAHGATLAGARAFVAGGRFGAITVVNGVAAPGVRRVVAVGGGRTQALQLGADHAFLAIFRGTPEDVRPRVTLTEAGGRATTLRFADTGEYLAPDPSGGAPWTVSDKARRVEPGLRCVQALRERGPDSPTPMPAGTGAVNFLPASVPLRCGARDAAFFDVRRFVPRNQTHGASSWWGLNAARTVAWGAAPRAGAVVTLQAPGRPRRIPVDPHTLGFAVILDGRVDPRAVHLTVDGAPLTPMAGVTGQRGDALAPAPATPPAWRSVASVAKAVGIPNAFVPAKGTARIARDADDPTGGPAWALRSWQARVAPRVKASDRTLRCFQIGHPTAGGGIQLPQPGGGNHALGFDEGESFCNQPRWLAKHAGGAIVRVEVDDASAADPRPQRVVVAGLLGNDVRSAELLGAGAPQPLVLGPDGTFLVVLGAEDAFASFRVRLTRPDGSVETSRTDGLETPCRLQPGRNLRVADPDGGPPWVYGRSRVGTRNCTFTGRVIAGRLVYITPDGTVHPGPMGFSSAPPGARMPRPSSTPSLRLEVQAPGYNPGRAAPATAPPAAQVARRTLPGRTLVLGGAPPDVVSVTIRTPRDVRTVKPVNGLFMAVYDGAFYTGEIVATGHRRDGTSVTARRPATLP